MVGGCQGAATGTPAAPTATAYPTETPAAPVPTPTASASATVTSTRLPSATPTCDESGGRLIEGAYSAVEVAGEVPLLVHLPPCYAADSGGYPTLYFLHGLPYDQQHWLRLGVIEQADADYQDQQQQPAILVLPYLPEPLFTGTDGGPGSYEEEFFNGVVAHIERTYAADPSRRGLAGISRGGVWALEIALRNPDEIGAVAALSPALAVNFPRIQYDPFELARTAERFPPSIMLLAGDTDWASVKTGEFSQLLLERGIDHQYLLVSGDHSDPTWESAVEGVLNFLTEALLGAD